MSICNTLQTAFSGMAAEASKIGTIGDNIATTATQLTTMTATRRSDEANSKVLATGSDMLSTIIQAIRP